MSRLLPFLEGVAGAFSHRPLIVPSYTHVPYLNLTLYAEVLLAAPPALRFTIYDFGG